MVQRWDMGGGGHQIYFRFIFVCNRTMTRIQSLLHLISGIPIDRFSVFTIYLKNFSKSTFFSGSSIRSLAEVDLFA